MAKADKREKKLREFLAKLNAGDHVQNRDLKTWLNAEIYADYLSEYEQQAQFRLEIKEKPNAVVEYERLLQRAIFAYNKEKKAALRVEEIVKNCFMLLILFLSERLNTCKK